MMVGNRRPPRAESLPGVPPGCTAAGSRAELAKALTKPGQRVHAAEALSAGSDQL